MRLILIILIFTNTLFLEAQDKEWIPFLSDSKFGYVNENLEILIEPQFDFAYPFYHEYAIIKNGDSHFIINKNGKYLTELYHEWILDYEINESMLGYEWSDSSCFSSFDTFYKLTDYYTNCGFLSLDSFLIDQEGIRITSSFDNILTYQNCFSTVRQNDLYGIVDNFGKQILPSNFKSIYIINDSMALINNDSLYNFRSKIFTYKPIYTENKALPRRRQISLNRYIYKENNKFGIEDSMGLKITSPIFHWSSFVALPNNNILVLQKDSISIIDYNGLTILELARNNYSIFKNFFSFKKDDKFYLFNYETKSIYPQGFKWIFDSYELDIFVLKTDTNLVFIDKNGKKFKECEKAVIIEDLICSPNLNGLWGCFDLNGVVSIDHLYDDFITPFRWSELMLVSRNGVKFYINRKGTEFKKN